MVDDVDLHGVLDGLGGPLMACRRWYDDLCLGGDCEHCRYNPKIVAVDPLIWRGIIFMTLLMTSLAMILLGWML